MLIETASIQRSKNGSLFITTTLAEVLGAMTESARAESAPVDPKALAKAKALLAELAKRETPEAPASSVSDDFLSF